MIHKINTIAVILLLIFLFFVPNIAIIVGEVFGTYLTYTIWSIAIVFALRIIYNRRSFGALDLYKSLYIALFLVFIYTFMGFFWGFSLKVYPKIGALLPSIALFLVELVGIEVSRVIAMGLVRNRLFKVIIGVMIGFFYGKTIHVVFDRVLILLTNPIASIPGTLYNIVLSLVYLQGGFSSLLVFRVLVDGYWRFSPLVLDTKSVGYAWSGISSLVYYALSAYLLSLGPSLKGVSKRLFKPNTFRRKVLENIPMVITACVSILLLTMVMNSIVPLVVISGSMRPLYDIGDVVFIKIQPEYSASIGDIVAYKMENGAVVIHRVIKVLEKGYITKGDANPDPDPFIVTKRQIIGKAIWSIPRIGWITIFLREGIRSINTTYSVVILAIIMPSIGLAIWWKKRHSIVKRVFSRGAYYA